MPQQSALPQPPLYRQAYSSPRLGRLDGRRLACRTGAVPAAYLTAPSAHIRHFAELPPPSHSPPRLTAMGGSRTRLLPFVALPA